jgi:hypothetical protein
MQYTKVQINSNIRRALEDGRSNDDALDLYLKMKMENDLGPERPFIRKGPSPSEIHKNLIGNPSIDKNDFKLELGWHCPLTNGSKIPVQRLVVKLSPVCTLYAETCHSSLIITINEKILTCIYLKSYRAEDIALWMIRQKQNLEKYIEGWDDVLSQACKKAKSNRMAFLGIRAMVTEAMKDYPRVKYQIIEQKRRARIKVMIPNTHLGVYLDAWWGSYRDSLPRQIESLKKILDVHKKSCLSNFFIYH